MAEILNLSDYPLAGARGRTHDEIAINPGGMLLDRILVPYELGANGRWKRVNQKKYPLLAQFGVSFDDDNRMPGFTLTHGEDHEWLSLIDESDYYPEPDVTVVEFGEEVPVRRRSSHISRWMCMHMRMSDDLLYLGQKTLAWQRGEGRDMSVAKAAPLHIVTAQSVEHAKSLINREKVSADRIESIGPERLRANVVINAPDDDPLLEQRITGLLIGKLRLPKARDTERCNVPGINHLTGQKMSDLPHAYKHLPKSSAPKPKPVLGAYFFPLLEAGKEVTISKGDKVEFIFD